MAKESGLKKYNPVTSTKRHTVLVDKKSKVTARKPEKKLSKGKNLVSGRRAGGKVTVRHRGGGVKMKYRAIDFARDKRNIEGKVAEIEYDPNRTCFIALVNYADGEKRYILAPEKLKIGDTVISGEKAPAKPGNAMPLKAIRSGTIVHNVELVPGEGGKIARTAGSGVTLQGVEGKYAQLKIPSGEIRLVPSECFATIGLLSNPEHSLEKLGKAGRKRHKGFRPAVRGVAMYGGAHPHGGGEARSKVGGPAKDKWGRRKGTKTRSKNKSSDKFILVRRTGQKVKH